MKESHQKSSFPYEVRRIFLAITKSCNIRCSYCFVKVFKGSMSYKFIERVLFFFLKTKGNDKLLYIYGGEPLCRFDLIKKINLFLNRNMYSFNKKIDIIVVTNGTILTDEMLNFFKRYNIKIMISLGGSKRSHDNFRCFKDGKGTYDTIIKNLKRLFNSIDSKNIWVSYTIHPKFIRNIFSDIEYFVNLGFENIHIEPVIYTKFVFWNNKELNLFSVEYNKLKDMIIEKIKQGKFIFLANMIRYFEGLLNISPTDEFLYSIYNNIRFWPKDEISFSHIHLNMKRLFKKGIKPLPYRIDNFDFENGAELNRNLDMLFHNYINPTVKNSLYIKSGDKIWSLYSELARTTAEFIVSLINQKEIFKRYVQESLQRAI